jgi:serine/threonine protein kinase
MTIQFKSIVNLFPKVYDIDESTGLKLKEQFNVSYLVDDMITSVEEIPTFDELYMKIRQLAKGVHSIVWECIHRATGRLFCVKVLTEEYNSEEICFWLYRQVKHENIIHVHEILMDSKIKYRYHSEMSAIQPTRIRSANGTIFLVMSNVDDGNLATYIARYRQHSNDSILPESVVQNLTVQMLYGLQYLHETQKVRHGNMNPSNILVQDETNNNHRRQASLCIADFGSSKRNQAGSLNRVVKMVPCKYDVYKAPELTFVSSSSTLNRKNDKTTFAACDMWSLAGIVHFMLTGYSPRCQNGVIHLPSHLSRQAKNFLVNCFQIDPSVRITASEALQHVWLQQAVRRHKTERHPSKNYVRVVSAEDLKLPLTLRLTSISFPKKSLQSKTLLASKDNKNKPSRFIRWLNNRRHLSKTLKSDSSSITASTVDSTLSFNE